MKVLMLWREATAALNRSYCSDLARLGVELTVVAPQTGLFGYRHIPIQPVGPRDSYRLIGIRRIGAGHHFMFVYDAEVARLLRQMQPDIIHLDEEPGELVCGQILLLRNLCSRRSKIVVRSWQNVFKTYPFPFNAIERRVLDSASVMIAGNQDVAEVLREKGFGGNIRVIPFGFPVEVYRRKDSPHLRKRLGLKRFVVGYVGRLVKQKGVDYLLRACAQFAQREAEFSILVIGDGPELANLKNLVARLGLGSQTVIIEGGVPLEEIPDYMNCLDVLVLPSVTMPTVKEQFGRVLVEAMLCEVPVVGSRSGEIPRVIGDAGLIVPERDTSALASAIESLYADPSFRRCLARAGRQRATGLYSSERIAAQTLETYREIQSETEGWS